MCLTVGYKKSINKLLYCHNTGHKIKDLQKAIYPFTEPNTNIIHARVAESGIACAWKQVLQAHGLTAFRVQIPTLANKSRLGSLYFALNSKVF